MKLGLLADIHEDVEHLQAALRRFESEAVDQVVVLGDIAEMNRRLDETCQLLLDAGAIGVWGNHDFGLCQTAGQSDRYASCVRRFMPTLRARLEIDECLFTHVEPWLDTNDLAELWYFDGIPDTSGKIRRSFEAATARLLFVGHFHRWLAATEGEMVTWHGAEILELNRERRYFVSIGAVCERASAVLDLDRWVLTPYNDP